MPISGSLKVSAAFVEIGLFVVTLWKLEKLNK